MTKLEFAITVDAPMHRVYEYTVNPNHWTAWYPGTTQCKPGNEPIRRAGIDPQSLRKATK